MHVAGLRFATSAILLGLLACTTTTFISTWRAPDVRPLDANGRKIAVAFMARDENRRRDAEESMLRELEDRGVYGITSYALIPGNALRDMDRVKSRLREAEVDGVVVMRLVEEKETLRLNYSPPRPTFASDSWQFPSYWEEGWAAAHRQTEIATRTVYVIETLIYSLGRDELLWAGTSRTVSLEQAPDLVEEVASVLAKQMTESGLLAGKPAQLP